MPINFDLSKYSNRIFIETGTYMGDGVKKALDSGFEKIYSIEIDKNRYINCCKLFENNPQVTIIHGDSGIKLGDVLKDIKEPATIFLDALYGCDQGQIGKKWCPIVEELEILSKQEIKNHTLLISNWRCMNNTHKDKKTDKYVGYPGEKKCLELLRKINPNYILEFKDGIEPSDTLICSI